jgi:TRAP-type C4-dicarboxylate transport system substrate-binding protein
MGKKLLKRKSVFSVITLAIVFSTFCLVPSLWAKTRELSLGVFSGSEHYHTRALKAWAKDVEDGTGGRIKIVIYPGGTLSKGPHAYNALIKGVQDISTACNGWTKGRFPLTGVVDLPVGMKTSVQASLVTWDFYNKFRPKEWDEVKLLYLFNHGHAFFHTKNEVRKVEDLKGMRIRSTGNDAPVVSITGATAVGMPMSESYIALQKGIVDGILCNFGAMKGWKLGEVTKWHLDSPVVGCAFWVAMNRDVWNSLSPDLQKIIDEVSERHVILTGKAWENSDVTGRQFVQSLGNNIVTIPPEEESKFQKVFKPILDDYVKKMEEKGLPGQEALDYVRSLVKKYEGR